MRLPSLQYIYDEATQAFKRFPFTLLSAIIGAAFLIFMIEMEYRPDNYLYLVHLILSCIVAIPLTFAAQLLIERLGGTRIQSVVIYGVVLLFLTLHYFSLPSNSDYFIPYIRLLLFNIAFHFLVAFIPYTHKGTINGFWHYNEALFIRFLTAVVFSATLFLGICFAYLCLDLLFDVEIKEKTFVYTFILCGAIFNTWFFVAGVPDNLATLDDDDTYPMGLKIFAQYILMPLMILYLVILYSYVGKIVIEWNWPRGIISYLILGVSVVGILALLLLHPLTIQKEHNWLNKVAKGYYLLLVPLSFVLSLAVWRRISEYGITENRYFLMLLAFWLVSTSLYFVFSRQKNIKALPISLFVLIVIAAVGPLSAFSISKNSQINRLEKLLTEEKLLINGQFQLHKEIPQQKISKEIFNIIDYLSDRYYLNELNHWFEADLDTILSASEKLYIYEDAFLDFTGLSNYSVIEEVAQARHYSFYQETTALAVTDFDYWFNIQGSCYHLDCEDRVIQTGQLENSPYTIKIVDGQSIVLQMGQKSTPPIHLLAIIDSVRQQQNSENQATAHAYNGQNKPLIIAENANNNYQAQFVIQNASMERKTQKWHLSHISGFLLVKEK